MCQQTTYRHSCTHKIKTPLLLCSLSSLPSFLHSPQKPTIYLLTPCPTCSAQLGIPYTNYPHQAQIPIITTAPQVLTTPQGVWAVPQVQIVPVPQIFTAPQLTPGPGSHGTPLSVPGNPPRSTRMELAGGRWQPVTHYHFGSSSPIAPTPAPPPPPPQPQQVVGPPLGVNHGWNPQHGFDAGALPPGWGVGNGLGVPQGNGGGGVGSADGAGWGGIGIGGRGGTALGTNEIRNAAATSAANFGWGTTASSIAASSAASNPAPNTARSPDPPSNPQQPALNASGTASTGSSAQAPVANANAGSVTASQSQEGINAATTTPNTAVATARNVRLESLGGMGTSSLDALTAVNTAANRERPASV